MLLGLIIGLFAHAVYNAFYKEDWLKYLVAQLLLVINMLRKPELNIMPGPYWFFGLMLEVYVIYRLIVYPTGNIKKKEWKWLGWFIPVALVLVAWLMQLPMIKQPEQIRFWRYNAAVAMLPFAIGVLVARFGFPRLPRWSLAVVAVVSLPLLACASLNYHSWLWTPVLVIAGSVAFVKLFDPCKGLCNTIMISPLQQLGVLSSMIFVVHSIPRMPIYELFLKNHTGLMLIDYAWLALYIVLTLALAWLYKLLLSKL